MKVTPISSPAQVIQTQESEQSRTTRLTAKFNDIMAKQSAPQPKAQAQTTQETPVSNPSQVSPEEITAVRQPKAEPQTLETSDNNEEVEVTTETIREQAKRDPEEERRFQRLAQQEKALRAKIQQANIQFKQREQALKQREDQLAQQPKTIDENEYIPKARLKEDALAVLEAEGITTYDEITQRQLNRQPVDPVLRQTMLKMEAQIAKLQSELDAGKQASVTQQQDSYDAAIKQITVDVRSLVANDPEFETIKSMKADREVVKLIENTYKEDGIVLSVEEAAREVETELIERALKAADLRKVKERQAALNASRQATEKKQQPIQQPQTKTLTNAASSNRPLTTRERAIAAMEGRLKS